ncbi:MAG: hypothetical protein JRZ94_03900 [Nitrososphaerota archaeon]|nr:hypothetical protein [Nitrososphaerota archaeon]
MTKKELEVICDRITGISPYIRFVGIINSDGNLLAYKRRDKLVPLLDSTATKNQFSHIAIKTDMEGKFDKALGKIQFAWEEREKVQTISFTIKKYRVWVSIDRKVIRSEVLRIIDSCFPIVKSYS